MVWCWRVREDRIIKDINLPFLLSFGHFVCPHGIDKMRINTNAITFCGDCQSNYYNQILKFIALIYGNNIKYINMSEQQIQNPSCQKISQFLQDQRFKQQPVDSSQLVKPYIAAFTFSAALFAAYLIQLNPQGVNRRIMHEKKLSPVARYVRRGSPLAILLGGVYTLDKYMGVWD